MVTQTAYIAQLNQLLATYQIHYQNIRALHWNIKGVHFFELHLKYEELYTRTQVTSMKVDSQKTRPSPTVKKEWLIC
jgi:DNA-binding ferritin-like protein